MGHVSGHIEDDVDFYVARPLGNAKLFHRVAFVRRERLARELVPRADRSGLGATSDGNRGGLLVPSRDARPLGGVPSSRWTQACGGGGGGGGAGAVRVVSAVVSVRHGGDACTEATTGDGI